MSGEVYVVSKIKDCFETAEAGLYYVLIEVPDYDDVMTHFLSLNDRGWM